MEDSKIIIEAWECCVNEMRCKSCPWKGNSKKCIHLENAVLDLLKRQQAEIERLKLKAGELCSSADCIYEIHAKASKALERKIRAEALLEFTEKFGSEILKSHKGLLNEMFEIEKELAGGEENEK